MQKSAPGPGMQVMPPADAGVQQESAAGADMLAMSAADAGVHQESGQAQA
jgi:hypothetical protein